MKFEIAHTDNPEPKKFAHKPTVVEALKYTGKNHNDVVAFTQYQARVISVGTNDRFMEIDTLEGFIYADKGDWIIKGVKGEFYPCKPDVFEQSYEEIIFQDEEM